MFRNISKLTASTLKYTSSFFTQYSDDNITPELIETWLKDTQIGLDALFDDRILEAEDIFIQNEQDNKSTFYAFGYALIIYTKAMLSLEKDKLEETLLYIQNLESTIKKLINSVKKKKKSTSILLPTNSSSMEKISMYSKNDRNFDHFMPSLLSSNENIPRNGYKLKEDSLTLHFELLHANCVIMISTLQFLNDTSWVDNIKAAYDLRKAFKMYENLFESISGVSLEFYEKLICQQRRHKHNKLKSTRRVHSFQDRLSKAYVYTEEITTTAYSETLENGIYFGNGLFNIVILLLPVKVRKVLTGLGFYSSTSSAIYLLEKVSKSQTIYSSLSSLLLLLFYTNISMYIQPQLNHFISFQDALTILNKMRTKYPNGIVWKLIEGKFKRLKGELDESLVLYKESKYPIKTATNHKGVHNPVDKNGNCRIASVADFIQFRAFVIYEIGWSYIYSGNYYQASESFFCLESLCNWSRIFYHYISTCCMIADGQYEKAELEVKQMVIMLNGLDNSKLSINDQYAESKVTAWLKYSELYSIPLKIVLQYKIINPVWELVYLWNGSYYWTEEMVIQIQQEIESNNKSYEPMSNLVLGVIYRDKLNNIALAMEQFNLILSRKENFNGYDWIIPYAMYEIATTHVILLKTYKKKNSDNIMIINEWIQRIENYYFENPQDKEWETRMQIRCQLLTESCNNI